jgi:hypothetical protein
MNIPLGMVSTMPKYFYQIFYLFDTYILYGILIA